MQLINIRDSLDYLPIVMDMIYDEWGDGFSSSKESKLEKIKTAILDGGQYPQIYILKDNDIVVGSFAILEHELKGCNLSPWLACVVVNRKLRGKGYGKILLQHIKSTIEQTCDKIYLTTKMVGFYEKIGFEFVKIVDNGENNRLYKKEQK